MSEWLTAGKAATGPSTRQVRRRQHPTTPPECLVLVVSVPLHPRAGAWLGPGDRALHSAAGRPPAGMPSRPVQPEPAPGRPPGCQPPRPARACRHHGFRWHSGTRAAAQQLSSAQRLSRFLGENLCSTCSQPRLFPRGWSPLDSEEVGGGGPQTTLPHRLCPLDTSPKTLSAPTPGPRLAAHTRTRPRDKCQAAKSSLGLPGPPLRHPPPGIRPTHWQRDKPVASGGTDAPGARAHPRRCQEPLASSKISTRDGLCVKGILSDLRIS